VVGRVWDLEEVGWCSGMPGNSGLTQTSLQKGESTGAWGIKQRGGSVSFRDMLYVGCFSWNRRGEERRERGKKGKKRGEGKKKKGKKRKREGKEEGWRERGEGKKGEKGGEGEKEEGRGKKKKKEGREKRKKKRRKGKAQSKRMAKKNVSYLLYPEGKSTFPIPA